MVGTYSGFCFLYFDDSLGQVTNVAQLRDVQPRDWAYVALQELVEHLLDILMLPLRNL